MAAPGKAGPTARRRKERRGRGGLYIICATMPTHSKRPQADDDRGVPISSASDSTREAETTSNKISRRRFARQAATVAAAASLVPAGLLALPIETTPSATAATIRPAGTLSAKAQRGSKKELTPEQRAEVEGRLANIVRKYGDRLTEEQRQHLRRNLEYHQTLLAPVRAFPLDQGDSPAFTLKLATGRDMEKGGAS